MKSLKENKRPSDRGLGWHLESVQACFADIVRRKGQRRFDNILRDFGIRVRVRGVRRPNFADASKRTIFRIGKRLVGRSRHEVSRALLRRRLLDQRGRDSSLHPSAFPREADRWDLFYTGKAARVSPACRERDATTLKRQWGNPEMRDASPSQLGNVRIDRIIRTFRRELSDSRTLSNGFSSIGRREPTGLSLPHGFKITHSQRLSSHTRSPNC